jgi:multiple sugar transport system permease protein
MITSFGLSFTKYNLLSTPEFIGFKNYIDLFSNTPQFFIGIKNTFIFTFFKVVIGITLSLFLSVLLNKTKIFRNALQTMFYLPGVLPFISGTLLWQFMFFKDFGLLNSMLSVVGLPAVDWMSYNNAMGSVILMSVWGGVGGTITLLMAALQSVPTYLYESLELDGAGEWRKFWNITLPMISPTLFYVVITGIIGCLQIFAEIMVLTNGGPMNATTTMTFQIYTYAFTSRRMGFACAYAWVVFLIVMIFTLLFFKYGNKSVYYENEGGDR